MSLYFRNGANALLILAMLRFFKGKRPLRQPSLTFIFRGAATMIIRIAEKHEFANSSQFFGSFGHWAQILLHCFLNGIRNFELGHRENPDVLTEAFSIA